MAKDQFLYFSKTQIHFGHKRFRSPSLWFATIQSMDTTPISKRFDTMNFENPLTVVIAILLLFVGFFVWTRYLKVARSPPHVAIDLSFSEVMSSKELASLRIQVKSCYTMSRKLKSKIYVASYEGGKSLPHMDRENYRKWKKRAVEFVPEKVEKMNGPWNEIIYLSPDSKYTLDDVRGDVLYVIGGIVDKRVKKNISLNRAIEMNAKTVRFPLKEYLSHRGSQVSKTELNVDTAYDILLRRRRGQTWNKIFDDVLPKRRKGLSYEMSVSKISRTMPVEFTEEQVQSMNKREIRRYNFKAWLLDSLLLLNNGTTANYETVSTNSTVDRQRWCSILIVKNADGKTLYHEKGHGHGKKSAEAVASWSVLRHLPEFFVKYRKSLNSKVSSRSSTAVRKRSKTPVRKQKKQ